MQRPVGLQLVAVPADDVGPNAGRSGKPEAAREVRIEDPGFPVVDMDGECGGGHGVGALLALHDSVDKLRQGLSDVPFTFGSDYSPKPMCSTHEHRERGLVRGCTVERAASGARPLLGTPKGLKGHRRAA